MVEGLRPMKLEDCVGVVLRREDSLECRMTGARDDTEALRESLLCSTTALTWAPGGKPAAFAGLVDGVGLEAGRVGTVWLLTTDACRAHPVAFHKLALRFLDVLNRCGWEVLRNHVDASYAPALRWLASLGFAVSPAAPWGPYNHPFCLVEWRR